jgi:integrase
MPKVALRADNVDAVAPPPERGQVEYFDDRTPGFAMRVTATGHRSWVVFYRAKGQLRRYTLGGYPQLGIDAARRRGREILGLAAMGKDPQAEKQSERRAETVRDVAQRYIEEHAKVKKRSWRADHNILHRDLIPVLGTRKAADVTRREIRDLLRSIAERGAPIQANRTLEIVRKLYNWAIAEELVENNPCDHVAKPSPENQRTRVLAPDEIRRLWVALDARPPIFAAAYRVMLATAQRSIEVLGAEREEICDGWWLIPPERVKNKTAHRVWLNEVAREAIKTVEPSGPYLFPSRDGGHLRRLHKTHGRMCQASGISDFKIHDLRRSAASHMAAAGVSRLVIAKVLNHKERAITAVYDRWGYGPEIRQALDAWGKRLGEMVRG